MIILGVNEDLFDSGVALCDGPRVVYAANEERFTRRKNEGGFPRHSLAALFEQTGIAPQDIDQICIAGHMTPPFVVRLFPRLHDWIFEAKRSKGDTRVSRMLDFATFLTPISRTSEKSPLRRIVRPLLAPATRRTLPPPLRRVPLRFVEHHLAHAAGAWWASGYEEALLLTADGMGDGLSMTVSRAQAGGGIERLWAAAAMDSFGLFFEALASAMGFMACRDEGKLTGLAAGGDPARVNEPSPFALEEGRLRYVGPHGVRAVRWLRDTLCARHSREDVAAWAQAVLEEGIIAVAKWWLRETRLRRLAVAGGVFANVKLNQRLHALDDCDMLFVYPNMGDGGLALGAVCAEQHFPPTPLRDVFLGDTFDDPAMERALQQSGLPYLRCENIESRIAALLAEGRIVARFRDRMEWGPRALGNRSILAPTTDRTLVERLNVSLARSDFMPFAPAILDEDADEYVVGAQAARHAAEFMTVCFDCTSRMRREHPAVVHLDGTARAQFVREETNPAFHRILREFKRATGSGVLLNTSFNIHEEPIVRTPEEAVAAFQKARLDCLAMGDFLVAPDTGLP